MPINRRDLLRTSAVSAGVLAVGNVGSLFTGAPAVAAPGGRGRLIPDPAGVLDLPAGFRYRIVSEVGDPLRRGGLVPDAFDGTAAFAGARGTTYLVRNHEQGQTGTPAAVAAPQFTYDSGAAGGTTTLQLDRGGNLVDEYVSLAGTMVNCAGGLTPWGSWLTCEETEAKKGGNLQKDHGFVFEVDPARPGRNRNPVPLTALGRYAHEAACIDPRTGHVYLTEDASNPNGLLYRCVPRDKRGRYAPLRAGGKLSAMLCRDRSTVVPDLSVYRTPGKRLSVEWVTVPDPQAQALSTRKQFQWTGDAAAAAGPVTRSRKFEGAWWGNGRAYVVCSFARLSDGSVGEHDGQVWSYEPRTATLRLEVRFDVNPAPESATGADLPDGPDNITVSPWGGLVLAEDGSGTQHLLAVASDGTTSLLARNARDDNEFTGACFSPDGSTLFANIQRPGVTFAIRGPFARTLR